MYDPAQHNYKLNDGKCLPSRGYHHEWSLVGHPLVHRCNHCHMPKWLAKTWRDEA